MIVLIRHATPRINYSSCNSKEANLRLEDYNNTLEIEANEINSFFPTSLFQKINSKQPIIYCSPLARAKSTCKLLFPHVNNYNIDSQLREISLTILPIPLLKLKVRTWIFIYRFAWIVGLIVEKKIEDK